MVRAAMPFNTPSRVCPSDVTLAGIGYETVFSVCAPASCSCLRTEVAALDRLNAGRIGAGMLDGVGMMLLLKGCSAGLICRCSIGACMTDGGSMPPTMKDCCDAGACIRCRFESMYGGTEDCIGDGHHEVPGGRIK